MDVIFERTGERRYAVIIEIPGRAVQKMHPAPGFDDHIPHDLVHYVVEAELGLAAGVFGRAAGGGGTFIRTAAGRLGARARARQQRRQRRRERTLGAADDARHRDMITSERFAALCDLAWRRRHGQRPDPSREQPPEPLSREDTARVNRIVARLDGIARVWHELPVGGKLAFTWPGLLPAGGTPGREHRSGDALA
jgi:hypothetical protein